MPLLALTVASTTLGAQSSAEVTVPVRIVVPPMLAIRSVVPVAARARPDSAGVITTTAIVNVESNLPYRLSVRLAPGVPDAGASVRGADGAFRSLERGTSIVAVPRGAPGHQSHEVVCRASAPMDGEGCALVYELSAEHHDMLIRTTASSCIDCGLRTTDPKHPDGASPQSAVRSPVRSPQSAVAR